MKSKWLVYAKKADFKAIEQKYGIDQVIARIMRNRDVCTDEEMQKRQYRRTARTGIVKGCTKSGRYFNGKNRTA